MNPLRFLDPTYDPVADLTQRSDEDPLARLKRLKLLPPDETPSAPPPIRPFDSPQEADSAMSSILGKTMGGLQYAAETLDKPGRIIRGLAGGNFRELGNAIPFSDTLGITDPTQSTSGRDLLEKAGVLGKNTPGFDAGDVAGFAADVALDPMTWIGLGGLTAAGKGAAKLGKVARAGGKGLTPAVDLAAEALASGKLAPTLESGIRAGQKGLFDVGVPFVPSLQTTLGTGDKAAAFAGKYVDPLADFLKYGNPVGRKVGQLFSPDRGNLSTELGQQLYSKEYAPQVRTNTLDATLPLQKDLRAAEKAGLLDPDHVRAMRAGGEGIAQPGEYAAKGGDTLEQAANTGRQLKGRMQGMVDEAQKVGVDLQELADDTVDYLPRYHHPDNWAGVTGKLSSIFRRKKDLFNPGRLDFLKGFPGGTNQVNDLVHDATVWGGDFKDAVSHVASELGGAGNEEITRQAEKVVGWVRSLDREKYLTAGADFFNADPISDSIIRAGRHAKQVTQANFVHELAARTAVKIDTAAQAVPAGMVPISDALEKAGLTFNKATVDAGKVTGLVGRDVEAARRLGLDPTQLEAVKTSVGGQVRTHHTVAGINQYFVPAEAADDMARFARTWRSPDELSDVVGAYDKLLNLWKGTSTQIWPGFHARNVISGLYYHMVSGAHGGAAGFLEPFEDAYHLLQGQPLKGALPAGLGSADDLVAELGATGVLRQGATAAADTMSSPLAQAVPTPRLVPSAPQTLAGRLKAAVGPSIEAAKKVPSAPGVVGKGLAAGDALLTAIDLGRTTGNFTEDLMRVGHYIAQRRLGAEPDVAAQSVKRWFFDYGELTQFEKNVMKRALPFYTFARNNIPLVLSELAKRPGGAIGQTIRAANAPRQDGGFVPQHISEGLAIKIPGGEGSRYLTGLGLPIESAFDPFSSGPTPLATVQRNTEGLIAQSSPALKFLYTAASGREPYSGRPLTDLYRSPTSSIGINALANSFAGTPISRVRSILDERKGPGAKALNFLTGMRVSDVSGGEDRARELGARKVTERILSENPQVRAFTDYHVPPDQRGQMTPETLLAMRLEATLLKHAKDAKKKQQLSGAGRL